MESLDYGVLAQLVERCVRIAEVRGSNPLSSTKQKQLALLCELFLFGYKSGGVMALASYASLRGALVRRFDPAYLHQTKSIGNTTFSVLFLLPSGRASRWL